MLIGITGGSGCGKSAAAEVFSNEGIEVIDADKAAREVTCPGGGALSEIAAVFGSEYIGKDGELLRKKLGSLVFSEPEMLDKLNKIINKYIRKNISDKIEKSKSDMLVLDAPLLIEYGLDNECDVVIAVLADREKRVQRIQTRDKISYQDAVNRINSQKKDEFYIAKADYIVYNNGKRDDVQKQVKEIIERLKEKM